MSKRKAPEPQKPIIAFREWGVEGDMDLLAPRYGSYSLGHNPWAMRGKAVARCTEHRHTPGSKGCTCGLYGYYEIPSQYRTAILSHEPVDSSRPYVGDKDWVFGAFVCWGEVTKARRGVRAQYARPVALRYSSLAKEVAKSYELTLADTPGELIAAAEAAGGVMIDPATLPSPPPSRTRRRTPQPGRLYEEEPPPVSSGYRSPATQAALYSAHEQTLRLTVTLVLGKEAEVIYEEGIEKLQRKMKVKGLDDKVWLITGITERMDRVDVAILGQMPQVAMKPGWTTIEVTLEGLLPENKVDYELAQLTKVGTVFQVESSRNSVPGTSNHGVGPYPMNFES